MNAAELRRLAESPDAAGYLTLPGVGQVPVKVCGVRLTRTGKARELTAFIEVRADVPRAADG